MKRDAAWNLGSETAKAGFKNERDIVRLLNQNPPSQTGLGLLGLFGLDLPQGCRFSAELISKAKADISISIQSPSGDTTNLPTQVKLVSNARGFNQIDKRWVRDYQQLWGMPDEVAHSLRLFSGEIPHTRANTRTEKRLFADELSSEEQLTLLRYLSDHRAVIAATTFKGSQGLPAEWLMIVLMLDDETKRVYVYPMQQVIDFYFDTQPAITPRGSIKFGKVTIQRKGGDRGRPSANMIQFKIDPTEIIRGIKKD